MTTTNNHSLEEDFRTRSYGKGELASMYITGVTQQSAVNRFNQWIRKVPNLEKKLQELGAKNRDRSYTPAQVQAIIEAIGEP